MQKLEIRTIAEKKEESDRPITLHRFCRPCREDGKESGNVAACGHVWSGKSAPLEGGVYCPICSDSEFFWKWITEHYKEHHNEEL